MRKRQKYLLVSILIIAIASITVLLFRSSYAIVLDNDVEVSLNSELIYYLNVSYDGIDKNGIESSDNTTSLVKSDYIYITDKIPDGLTFTGFVTTSDGSIGSVERESNIPCGGKVVDDTETNGVWNHDNTIFTYHGLRYDANTREVSFKVKNLQAGCVLTVGIKTQTPNSIDDSETPNVERRRDFYNFASAKENSLLVNSNTVHAYMGKMTDLYKVKYEYAGEIPLNVPDLPLVQEYAESSKVGIALPVNIEGYRFLGWETQDVQVTNNSFVMPENDVTFRGEFEPIDTHKVTYVINGIVPEGYVVPLEKEYYKDANVTIDKLKNGDVISGYKFSGWSSSTISSLDTFIMPDTDVIFYGEFSNVTYKLSYAFYDTILPPNSDSLLPDEKFYRPGDEVVLDIMQEVSGYEFLGWYKENSFAMPNNDVIVYGEWKEVLGNFRPTITKSVCNSKDYYEPNDTITFKITLKNNNDFTLKDIFIKENNDSSFIQGNGYEVITSDYAKIVELGANDSIDLYSTYKVKLTDKNKIYNEAELVGALASNGYELENLEYKASASANIKSKIKICKRINGIDVGNTFQIKISNENYETWVILSKDECKNIYVNPGVYRINEIVPQEYRISSVEGINANNSDLVVLRGIDYDITYTNEFVKKGFLHSSGKVVNKVGGINGYE